MHLNKPTIRIYFSIYNFKGLAALIMPDLWPSYFAKYFNGPANFNLYFYAAIVTLLIAMIITQPLLISINKLVLHRFIGPNKNSLYAQFKSLN